MNVNFPVLPSGNSDTETDLYRNAEANGHGTFPVGSNGFWHGGIHLNCPGQPIRAIADGVIVAYRMNDKPVDYEGMLPRTADGSEQKATYSSSFVLIQHKLKTPQGAELKYYSLYAHLKPMSKEETEARPAVGQAASVFQKTDWVVVSDDDGGGMPVVDADVRVSRGVIPFGARFTVHPNDEKCNNHRYRRIRRIDDIVEGYIAADPGSIRLALANLKSSKGRILEALDIKIVDGKGVESGKILPRGGFFTEESSGSLRYEKVEYLGNTGYALVERAAHAGQRQVPSAGPIPVVDVAGADLFSIPPGKQFSVLAQRPPATSAIAKRRCFKIRYPDPKGARKLDGYAFLRLGYDVGPLAKTSRDDGNLHLWGNDAVTVSWSNEILGDGRNKIGELNAYNVFELLDDDQVPANHWSRSIGWRKVSWDAQSKQGQAGLHVEGYSFVGPHAKKVEESTPNTAPDESYQLMQRPSDNELGKIVQPPKNASIRYTPAHKTIDLLAVEKAINHVSRPWNGRYNGVSVRYSASATAPVVAVVGMGTVIHFKEEIAFKIEPKSGAHTYAPSEEKYRELSDGGFVLVSSGKLCKQAEIPKPIQFNAVVCPNPPVPIRCGEVVGWPGHYATIPSLVHFEVFTKDHVFTSNTAKDRWGSRLILVDLATKLFGREVVPPREGITLLPGVSVRIEQRSYGSKVRTPASTFCNVKVLAVTGWIPSEKLEETTPGSNQRKLRVDLAQLFNAVRETKILGVTQSIIDEHKGYHPIPGKQGDRVTVLEDKGAVCKVEYSKDAGKDGWIAQDTLLRACKRPRLDPLIGTYWYELGSSLALMSSDPSRGNRFREPPDAARRDAFRLGLANLKRVRKDDKEYAAVDEKVIEEVLDTEGKSWVGIPFGTERGWIPATEVKRVSLGYDWIGWEFFDEQTRLDDQATANTDEGRFSEDGFCDVDVILRLISESETGSDASKKSSHERLRQLACCHPSEWDAEAQETGKKYERLKPHMPQAEFDKLMSHITKMHFWREVVELPRNARVWHFHPVGFVAQLRRMQWITRDQLIAIFGRAAESRIDRNLVGLNDMFQKYEINTPFRIAHFLAQVGVESEAFRYTEECGAEKVGRNYEGRRDLGNILPGDGRRFIGRGFAQLTGRANYELYEVTLGEDITSSTPNAEKLRDEPRLACDSAGWYWTTRARVPPVNLNALADNQDGESDIKVVEKITREVNGGVNHLGLRVSIFQKAKRVLCGSLE